MTVSPTARAGQSKVCPVKVRRQPNRSHVVPCRPAGPCVIDETVILMTPPRYPY